MALYDRLVSHPPTLWPDRLLACLQEFTLNKMTAEQAVAALQLSESEAVEADNIRLAILNGNAALMGTNPWDRLQEVAHVLRLAAIEWAPYDTVQAVATRLGL
jgi:hypothetical protein